MHFGRRCDDTRAVRTALLARSPLFVPALVSSACILAACANDRAGADDAAPPRADAATTDARWVDVGDDLCRPGELARCGACATGRRRCRADGVWTACEGASNPHDETCDGVDEDCDGLVDEALTRTCGNERGRCRLGLETCEAGQWSACVGSVGPADEICNGADDDCDGRVDELPTRACGSAIGACRPGQTRCDEGIWSICDAERWPLDVPEQCDGRIDDDCDGAIDEGCACTIGAFRDCGSDVGACRLGRQACDAGRWGECVGAATPIPGRCNGIDDDCNDVVVDLPGIGHPCGGGFGACRVEGNVVCAPDTGEIACDVVPGPPEPERCDGVDNDCDGEVDEDIAFLDGPAVIVPAGAMAGLAVARDPDGDVVLWRDSGVGRAPGVWAARIRPGTRRAEPAIALPETTDVDGEQLHMAWTGEHHLGVWTVALPDAMAGPSLQAFRLGADLSLERGDAQSPPTSEWPLVSTRRGAATRSASSGTPSAPTTRTPFDTLGSDPTDAHSQSPSTSSTVDGVDSQVRMRFVDAQGAPVGASIAVARATDDVAIRTATMAPHNEVEGAVAFAWVEYARVSPSDTHTTVASYRWHEGLVGPAVRLEVERVGDSTAIVSTGDRFGYLWTDAGAVAEVVFFQWFANDGTALGPIETLPIPGQLSIGELSLDTMPGGRRIAWRSQAATGHQPVVARGSLGCPVPP